MKTELKFQFKKYVFIVILCFSGIIVFSQDIHFTMFENSPLFMGPANTGLFEGSHRVVLNYRNQWASVTVPYVTMAASADMKFSFRRKAKILWAAGISVYKDQAGDSEYGTTQITFYGAPIVPLNSAKTSILSVGMGFSLSQKKINYSALYFDNQYSGFGFDPGGFSNETFNTDNMLYPDLDIGINYRNQQSKRQVLNVGFTVNHAIGPAQSFGENPEVVLDAKYTIFVHGQKQVAESFDICPVVFYQHQGTFREFMFGGNLKFIISPNPDNYTALYTGVYSRLGDMAALSAGIEFNTTVLSFSYDINYSNLTPASRSIGGFEFSLSHRFSNYKFMRKKTVSCPVF